MLSGPQISLGKHFKKKQLLTPFVDLRMLCKKKQPFISFQFLKSKFVFISDALQTKMLFQEEKVVEVKKKVSALQCIQRSHLADIFMH